MTEAPIVENRIAGRLRLGLNHFREISPRPGADLDRHIVEEVARIEQAHRQLLPPGFDLARRLYRAFHVDPTKHRPSSEALWRRLKGRGEFPRVNPYVDLTNLLSLGFQVCFGLYDLEKVEGDITVTVGGPGDRYQGIRKDVLNMEGRIVLRDERGPFGNPSADALRCSVDASSRHILQVLFFHPEDPLAGEVTRQSRERFGRFFAIDGIETTMA